MKFSGIRVLYVESETVNNPGTNEVVLIAAFSEINDHDRGVVSPFL